MKQGLPRFACMLIALLVSGPAAAANIVVRQPLSPCIDADTGKPFAPKPADVIADSGTAKRLPWGVQLTGGFSRKAASAQFDQIQQAHPKLLGNYTPLLFVSCQLNLGEQLTYSFRVGMTTQQAADTLCNKLQAQNVACVVNRN